MASPEQPFDERELVCHCLQTSLQINTFQSARPLCIGAISIARANHCFSPLQRYFLAEILKVSTIAPYDLFTLIQARGISPKWNDIALPNGALGISSPGHGRSEDKFRTGSAPQQACPRLPKGSHKLTYLLCRTLCIRMHQSL